MTTTQKRVAIIGAGASGLPSIRHALLYGLEPVCFELTNSVGGLWNYKEEKERHFHDINVSSVMKTTVINTSKEMTAFSDFPPKAEYANFMHNTFMREYLQDYATNFNLQDYIKFQHRVLSIERNEDYKTTGRWKVTYVDPKGDTHVDVFDGVMLANGHHADPNVPKPWPGQDKFKGNVIHAHDYLDHKGYEEKVVAVVGIGNSGGDVCVELSRIAKQVYLVTRRGSWILNRLIQGGTPFDVILNSRSQINIRKHLPIGFLNWLTQRDVQKGFDHDKYGLRPAHGVYGAHPTINDEIPTRLANKTARVKPNIKEFTETGIIFEDGTYADPVDEVILCTGYRFNFSLVEGGKLIPVKDNITSLYLNMYPPDLSDHNSIIVMGLVQPWGSIMPISEIQARLFFDTLVGRTKLPNAAAMAEDISRKREGLAARYVNSPRHTVQVDFGTYMDEIADILGCTPKFWPIFKKDPALAWTILNGPATAYTYRVLGPHPWNGAKQAIETTEYRIRVGMAPEGQANAVKAKLQSDGNSNYLLTFLFILFVAFLINYLF